MFGMDKKYKEMKEMQKDPDKALDNAEKTLNKGLTGFMTKAFMGNEFVNDMNATMQKGREAVDMQKAYQNPSDFGVETTAEVVSMQDTGQLINFNPVVNFQLKVMSAAGIPFDMAAQAIVSKIAVPRVGDTIKIKYNPADMTKVVILQ
jgi:hypothetical protein